MELDEEAADDVPVTSRHTGEGFRIHAVAAQVAVSPGALCSPDSRQGVRRCSGPGPSVRKPVEGLHEWRRELIGRFLILWPVHGFSL